MLLQDLTEVVKGVDFKVFSEAPAVKAIVVKGAADNYSRKDIDKMTEVTKTIWCQRSCLGQGS